MKIFGKSLSEYIRFQAPILLLIVVVGLIRLGLSLAGVSNNVGRWFSVSAVLLLGVVVYAVRVPRTGFGSYRHLLPLVAIQTILAQLIVIAGIVIAIYSGKDNIYSAPEYSPQGNGRSWFHVVAHCIAMVVASLIGWGIAALLMLIVNKSSKSEQRSANARA
jgi:uncharacterized membrane protein